MQKNQGHGGTVVVFRSCIDSVLGKRLHSDWCGKPYCQARNCVCCLVPMPVAMAKCGSWAVLHTKRSQQPPASCVTTFTAPYRWGLSYKFQDAGLSRKRPFWSSSDTAGSCDEAGREETVGKFTKALPVGHVWCYQQVQARHERTVLCIGLPVALKGLGTNETLQDSNYMFFPCFHFET